MPRSRLEISLELANYAIEKFPPDCCPEEEFLGCSSRAAVASGLQPRGPSKWAFRGRETPSKSEDSFNQERTLFSKVVSKKHHHTFKTTFWKTATKTRFYIGPTLPLNKYYRVKLTSWIQVQAYSYPKHGVRARSEHAPILYLMSGDRYKWRRRNKDKTIL